jgi:hypothetical protein
MSLHRRLNWFIGVSLAASLSGSSRAFDAEPLSDASVLRQGQLAACLSSEEFSKRALARHLGEVSVHDETVGRIAARLETDYEVPLSFIETNEDVKISLAMSSPTVQEVLAKIVDLAPVYRYATIAGHIVLYPRNAKWDARLDALHLGPGTRYQVAGQLVDELARRLPTFSNFGTNLSGDAGSYVFVDRVAVMGSGSVVELLAQLLGTRPSAIFSIKKLPVFPSAQLFLGGVQYWQSLKLIAAESFMHPGEVATLTTLGTLEDGTSQNATAEACGTVYGVSDEHVISVSANGVLTARSTGEAWLQARNANQVDTMHIQVTPVASWQGPVSACLSPEEFSRRALARRLRELSANNEAVGSVVARLETDYDVPLSFIENKEDVKVTFAMSGPTVQEALAKIVELAPAYRYATIAGHLLLFSRSAKWDERLEGIHLGPAPRDRVASQLAEEIRHKLPAFADFGANLIGNHNTYVFNDPVSVTGSGSVVELLVQLLGTRPPAVFSVNKLEAWPAAQLFLGGVHYWQALKLIPSVSVMHPGEAMQLKAIGALEDGTRDDVTAGCGSIYLVNDEHIIAVSADGLVTARAMGEAYLEVRNADESAVADIKVVPPTAGAVGGSAAVPAKEHP